MNILGIDLGTHCGWALNDQMAGTWDLTPGKGDSGGMRLLNFRAHLRKLFTQAADGGEKIEMVAYEEVSPNAMRGPGGLQTNQIIVYFELLGVLLTYCEDVKVPYTGVQPPTIKKWATAAIPGCVSGKPPTPGKGNANKAMMIEAAKVRWPGFRGDDNEADARLLRGYAEERYGSEKEVGQGAGSHQGETADVQANGRA